MNNKTIYYIRMLVSAYLLYLSYGIAKGLIEGTASSTWMWIPVIVFVGCSVLFIVSSVKALNRISKEEAEAVPDEEELEEEEAVEEIEEIDSVEENDEEEPAE